MNPFYIPYPQGDIAEWGDLARLVPEAVLIIMFSYFTIQIVNLFMREAAQTRTSFTDTITRLEGLQTTSARERDDQWRKFLDEQRASRHTEMLEVVKELRALVDEIGTLQTIMRTHDESAQRWWSEQRGEIRGRRATEQLPPK